MRRIRLITWLLVVGIALAPAGLWAQSLVSGDIAGTVKDPSGAVVPDATVALKSLDQGTTQTTTTNASGMYRFSLLRPGQYEVTATKTSFQKSQRKVTVALGTVATTDFSLTVGSVTETVEVSAEASLINTQDANTTTAFNNRDVSTLPNPGNDLTNIALNAPGVALSTSGGYGNFTANGLPATSNLFTINGENDMDPFFNISNSGATNLSLGLNEVQEASVVTNPYSAQYGQQAGAQVNIVTKAGTNRFHGAANYYWNGRAMNANDWFANNNGATRPFANDNQWGADFGGPIQKDKTFFYVNTEGLRLLMPTSQNTYLPTSQFANASLAYIQANQPNSYNAYKNLYAVWLAAPGVANAKQLSGAANCPGMFDSNGNPLLPGWDASMPCRQNFTSTVSSKSTEWILSGRVDHNFGENDKIFGRYRMDRGLQSTYTSPINAQMNAISSQPQYDGQAHWTHMFSGGKAANDFASSLTWYSAMFTMADTAGYDLMPVTPIAYSGGFITTPNENYAFPQGRKVTQYQFIDDYSRIVGSHNLKFGANFRRFDVTDANLGTVTHPEAIFQNLLQLAEGTDYYFAQRFPQQQEVPIAMYGLGIYANDDWRISSKLTLTLGLRLEHNSNPVCQTNCFQRFNTPFEDQTLGPNVPYNSRIMTGLHQAYAGVDGLNFSPRFGFSYSPSNDKKTIISGGIGIFYDAMSQGIMENAFLTMPFQNRISVYNSLWADPTAAGAAAQAAASSQAIATGFANGATFNTLSSAVALAGGRFSAPGFTTFTGTMHTPQFQEWNLQIQRELSPSMSFSIAYTGSHGIHIPVSNSNLNAYDRYGIGAGLPATVPDPSFGTVAEYSTAAVSNNNGVTLSFTRRLSHGIQFQTNYTWAHALDEISNGGAFYYGGDTIAYGTTGQMNPTCLRCSNYGNADYDIRHNFTSTLLWQVPNVFSNAVLKNIVGGWTFSGSIFAHSSLPYTVVDGNVAGANGATILAQPTGYAQLSCSNPSQQCFNPAEFVDSSSSSFVNYATYPTQRRNQYRGPGFFDSNFVMNKDIKLREGLGLTVGANFFNVFNHPNFANPDYYLGDGGSITGYSQSTVGVPASLYGSFMGAAAAPRLIQLHAKITF